MTLRCASEYQGRAGGADARRRHSETTAKLIALGYDVVVESGAGMAARFPDEAFVQAGASIGTSAAGRRPPSPPPYADDDG